MSKAAAPSKEQLAEQARQDAYKAGAGALQKAIGAACGQAAKAGLSDHEQANELRAIAQRLDDGKGAP